MKEGFWKISKKWRRVGNPTTSTFCLRYLNPKKINKKPLDCLGKIKSLLLSPLICKLNIN